MRKERQVSRREKMESLVKDLQSCIDNENKDIKQPFDKIMNIIEQYLDFDPVLPRGISSLLTQGYNLVFKAIRYFTKGQYFKEAYSYYKQHLVYLIEDDQSAEISANLSYIFWMFDDLKQSLEHGKHSVKLLEKTGNTSILPGRYSNIGYVYECMGDLDEALGYYQLGMQYGMQIQSEEALSLAYTGCGRIAAMQGNIKQSLHYFLEAKKRIQETDIDNYLSVTNNLGITYGSMGMHQEALNCFVPFINEKILREHPDTFITFSINAANCYNNLNQLDKEEEVLYNALNCATSLDFYNDISAIMVHLGNLMLKQKKHEQALEWYQKAHIQNSNLNAKRQKLVILLGIASANIGLKKYDKAIKALKMAEPISIEMNLQKEQSKNHELLSIALQGQGNIEESFEHFKKFSSLQMKMKDEKYKNEIETIKNEYQKTVKQPQRFAAYSSLSLISRELQKSVKMPIVGCSNSMQEVISKALLVAENDNLPVLITGETGSGKEVIARIIHYSSSRKNMPYIAVNCSAFTSSLVESAFFGSEKGAFTGASEKKIGYFEAADNGTLFLDEIGDMPVKMQAKFLRVIEDKIIHRIGSTKNIQVDFRLILASNKNLVSLAASNEFRFDLLNRINVMQINIPPLRERKEDIPLIVDYYLNTLGISLGHVTPLITKEAMDLLVSHSFPGNIRELKNILHRGLLQANDGILRVEAINLTQNPCNVCKSQMSLPSLNLSECERWIIDRAMLLSGNVQKEAAQLLGIAPCSLSRRLKRIKMQKES